MGNVTIWYSAYDFLFNFDRNYASILYRFRDIASYLLKVSACIWHPRCRWGRPRWKFVEILQSLAYRAACLCDFMFSRFNRTPTCDRRTERRTERARAYTALAYRRALKMNLSVRVVNKTSLLLGSHIKRDSPALRLRLIFLLGRVAASGWPPCDRLATTLLLIVERWSAVNLYQIYRHNSRWIELL